MTRAWNRGDAVAAGARGEPPALEITTSTPPNRSRPAAISRRACSGSLTSARRKAAVADRRRRAPRRAPHGAPRGRAGAPAAARAAVGRDAGRSCRRPGPGRRSAGTRARCPPRCPSCLRSRSPGSRRCRETVGRRAAWRHVRLTPKQTLGQVGARGRHAVSVEVRAADGIAEVIIDYPPVNALPVRGWYDLAAAVAAAGADPGTRAVILAAAGRGFCAGVDIKEMQRSRRGTRRCSAPTGAASPRSPRSTTARCR